MATGNRPTRKSSSLFLALTVALFFLVGVAPVRAQEVTGSISGTITDSSGAAINGATLTFTDVARGQDVRTLTTDNAGFYTARSLPLATYTIRVVASGFKTDIVAGLVLHVNDTLTVNRKLVIGSSEQQITVEADALQLNLENATQAGLISGTQTRELVLNNRNYEQLVALQPGVAYSGGDQLYIGNSNPSGQTNVVNFSVNGSRTSGNNWTVDGADNVDRGSNFTLLTYPSVDAIAEFKTLRGNYSAEFGRSASGQINVITKSGTNSLHGSAYEFVRNDVFNANSVLNKTASTVIGRPRLRYNDFGYTVGGPVRIPKLYDGRDKTFFFFSQEIRRVITYASILQTGVPTAAEVAGNFAQPVCPGKVTLSGPTAGQCSVAPVRRITNIDPVAAAYIKDVYSKVQLGDANHNVTSVQRNIYNANQQLVRIDQQFGNKVSAYFRFINDIIPTVEPGGLFQGSSYAGVQTTSTNAPGRTYLGHVTYSITPSLLLDGGYAFSYGALLSDPIGFTNKSNSPDINPTLPFATTLSRVPSLAFSTGGSNIGVGGYGPYRDYNRNHNIFVNATKIVRTHSLRFGVDYDHYQKTENNAGANQGTYTFSNAGTLPGGTAAQPLNYVQQWANFLTGFVTNFTQASIDISPDIRVQQIEGYFQDDWKVTPRLTLNLGLRYSRFNQPTDANRELTTFDPALYSAAKAPTIDTAGNICATGAACTGVSPNPAYDPLNGISVNGGSSPYGQKVGEADSKNFAPRFGFALDVFGNGKTSLRGGFGTAYDSSLFGTYEQNIFANKPFVNTPSVPNTCFSTPAACNAAAVSFSPIVVRGTAARFHTPYVQQFSLDIQHQLPTGIVLDVAYVGNTGRHLIGLIDINEVRPGAYVGAGLGALNTATGFRVINTTNTPTLNRIRPYLGYNAINVISPVFMQNYNSLQVSGQKQWTHGSIAAVNYTWSRALTNSQADRTGAPQNSYDLTAEYGRTAADRTHMLNYNVVYSLPFFYNQRGLVGHLVGGWEISSLGFFNSGLPLTATTSGLDPAGVGFLGSSAAGGRPDRIADANSQGTGAPVHTFGRWFNTGAFAAVPNGQYRVGNEGRGVINGPGWWRVDAGLFRNIAFYRETRLQLRGEFFDVFNHTNADTVGTALTTASTFGRITGYRDKRILQLGAKFIF